MIPSSSTYTRIALVALLTLGLGCSQTKATTMEWVRVETDDLIIRTDVRPQKAVALAKRWQALQDAIAENELPCAFERSNAPFEFVMLKDPADIEDLHRLYTSSFRATPPSDRLHSKTQLVIDYGEATMSRQVFMHNVARAAVALCFPGAPPWLRYGMGAFYRTATIRDGSLLLGMPPFGFVHMDNVEPTGDIYPVRVNATEVWMLPLRLAPDFEHLRSLDRDQFYFRGKRRSREELRARTAYFAGSWNAVHMLQFGDEVLQARFQDYLTSLHRGEEDDPAWSAAFRGVDVSSHYDRYLRRDYKMMSSQLPPSTTIEPTVHAMSEAEVGLLWARLYGWSDDDDQARATAFVDAAAATDPDSTAVMLHRAAIEYDTVGVDAGEQWLERALQTDPENPTVLATAILWYGHGSTKDTRRADLHTWGEALARTAQTAFEYREYGRFLAIVADDPAAALEPLNRSLALDATDWRTYAYAGQALADLGRTRDAVRAYQTAIALTAHESSGLRAQLKDRVDELHRQTTRISMAKGGRAVPANPSPAGTE